MRAVGCSFLNVVQGPPYGEIVPFPDCRWVAQLAALGPGGIPACEHRGEGDTLCDMGRLAVLRVSSWFTGLCLCRWLPGTGHTDALGMSGIFISCSSVTQLFSCPTHICWIKFTVRTVLSMDTWKMVYEFSRSCEQMVQTIWSASREKTNQDAFHDVDSSSSGRHGPFWVASCGNRSKAKPKCLCKPPATHHPFSNIYVLGPP